MQTLINKLKEYDLVLQHDLIINGNRIVLRIDWNVNKIDYVCVANGLTSDDVAIVVTLVLRYLKSLESDGVVNVK